MAHIGSVVIDGRDRGHGRALRSWDALMLISRSYFLHMPSLPPGIKRDTTGVKPQRGGAKTPFPSGKRDKRAFKRPATTSPTA